MAALDEKKLDEALNRAKADIEEAFQRYDEALKQAKIGDGMPGIYVFERLWSELDGELRRIHAQLIRSTIGSIEEKADSAAKEEGTE